jgi:hypothetical protein
MELPRVNHPHPYLHGFEGLMHCAYRHLTGQDKPGAYKPSDSIFLDERELQSSMGSWTHGLLYGSTMRLPNLFMYMRAVQHASGV